MATKIYELNIDRGDIGRELKGFGASSAWWSQDIDSGSIREKLAKALFSAEGLNLGIYRYNIGSGEKESPARRVYTNRASESFYLFDESSGKWYYDFSRDKNARAFLAEALKGSVKDVVMFATSPHYSMTVSGSAAGHPVKHTLNLRKDAFYEFSEFLVEVTRHFMAEGVPVSFLSPLNEPQWSWGGEYVSQEGCHFEPEDVARLLDILGDKALKDGIKLSMFESGSIRPRQTKKYIEAMKKSVYFDTLDHIAVHSYWADGNIRVRKKYRKYLEKTCPGKEIHMTEWCELPCRHRPDDVEGAVIASRTISDDLNFLGASAWTAWKGFEALPENIFDADENKTDALVYAREGSEELFFAKRYYALKHYSAFWERGSRLIRAYVGQGAKELRGNNRFPVTAYTTPSGRTAAVVTNVSATETPLYVGKEAWSEAYLTDEKNDFISVPVAETVTLPPKSILSLIAR